MEGAVVFLASGLLLLLVGSPVLALVAFVRALRLERRVSEVAARLAAIERRLRALSESTAAPLVPERPPRSEARAPRPPADEAGAPVLSTAAGRPTGSDVWLPGPSKAGSLTPAAGATDPPPRRPRRTAPSPSPDFASYLGPRLLVTGGGLAVVVFLGLFVRYAWENQWVGPTGRVLSGAVFGLGLVAGGLRLLGREYRPLGQGLAAAGFAGLYVSSYAAHGFYALVSREVAAGLMIAVLACAVVVAQRLGTRLLASLAWVGGYLAPVLLSTGADRAESLLAWLLMLGAGAIALTRRRVWPEVVLLALAGTVLLSVGWSAAHFRAERLGVAASGIVLLTALFALGPSPRVLAPFVPLLAGGVASLGVAVTTDRPMTLLALLAALLGVAALARHRWAWAEASSAVLGVLAVLLWHGRHLGPERGPEALALGVALAGLYVLVLTVRGLLWRRPLGLPEAVVQIVSAGLAWLLLDRVLSVSQPQLLGPSAVGLAALHLALGLAARRQGTSPLWARVALALAAVFVTLAIPVQLGLFGATLGWAAEGLVLVWLGLRQGSSLARAGGYAVLLFAVGRLLFRHLPLHEGPFVPVVNPAFATWVLVIVALGLPRWMTRRVRGRDSRVDQAAGVVLGSLGLVLFFGLLTAETQDVFAERARVARVAGDVLGVVRAQKQAGLAVSLLWTLFATGLLAAGLAVRSRVLFYAAYGLFGFTAMKVVMVDLATLPTLYRMLSFLVLGLLLLAGAWLNIRFRERLPAPGGGA